jgi:lysophospholipase L1-like esterase
MEIPRIIPSTRGLALIAMMLNFWAMRGLDIKIFQDKSRMLRIACVGDSLTLGQNDEKRTSSYPSILMDRLGDKTKYNISNFGVASATVFKNVTGSYWGTVECKASKGSKPDIVVIQFGTSDSAKVRWKGEAAFRTDYIRFIEMYHCLWSSCVAPRQCIAARKTAHVALMYSLR